MIDAKEAVRIALDYVRALYDAEEIPHLTLEEVELSVDQEYWHVTVSFLSSFTKSPIEAMTSQHGPAMYKILKLRAEDGQVHSMKMRTV